MASYEKFEIRKKYPRSRCSALLVIDAQNYFDSMVRPILPGLNATITLCRGASVPIFYTRHRHKTLDPSSIMFEWWNGDLILDGTPESQLIPDLLRSEADPIILKETYSAFHGTGLEEKLREMGIEEVIISGVMTNLCCETTARDAFVRGFRVFFSTDATATSSPELHDATLKNIAYGFAYLVDCRRLREAFSAS